MTSPINGSISKKRPHSEDIDHDPRNLKISKTNNFICWKISNWSLDKFKAKIEKYGCDFLFEQFKMCHHEKNNSQENIEKFQSIMRHIRQCGQVDLQSKVLSFFSMLKTELKSVMHTLESTNSIESLLNKLKNSQSLEDRLIVLEELKLLASKEETANKLMETELVSIIKDLIMDHQMLDPESHNLLQKNCLECLINVQNIEGMSIRLHQNVHFSEIISWSLAQMANNDTSRPLRQICLLISNMTTLQGEIGKSIVEKRGIEAFINCLFTKDNKILRYALRGLAYLPYEEELATKMGQLGVIEIFLNFSRHADKIICQHCAGGLSYLSAFGQAAAIVKAGGISILLKLVSSDVSKIQEAALGALANLESKQYCEQIYQEAGLDLFIDVIKKGTLKRFGKEQALRSLSYMTALQDAVIKEILEKGVIALFIQNSSTKYLQTLQYISFGLFRLLSNRNKEIAAQIAEDVVNNGGVEAILEMTNQKDFYVRNNTVWSLLHLSLSAQYNHLINAKGIETLLQLINEPKFAAISVSSLSILAQKNPQKFVENGGISAFAVLLRRSPTEKIIEEVLKGLASISSTEQSLMALSFNSKLPSLLFSLDDVRAQKLIEQFKAQQALGTVLGAMSFEEFPLLALNLALLFPEKNPFRAKKDIVKMLVEYYMTAVKEVSPTIHQLPLPFYCYLMALDNLNSQKTESVKTLKIQGKEDEFKVSETPDLQLIAGEGTQSIACHRHVMIQSSDYFKSMFNVSMKEQEQSEVRLEEISQENLQRLIDLSYSKTVTFSLRKLFDLLTLADRYQMEGIKSSLWQCLVEHQIPMGEDAEEKAQNLEDFGHVLDLLQENFKDIEGAELVPFLDWTIRHWRWFKEQEEASTCLFNFLPCFNHLI